MKKTAAIVIVFVCVAIILYIWVLNQQTSKLYVNSQLLYAVVGTYKGKSAQGMAIWKNKACLFNNGGHCRILNLQTGIVEREFNLGSSGENMHVATACFGKTKMPDSEFPLLYVAEFTGKSRCFVESINGSNISNVVQVIEAKERGKNYRIQCWLVDSTDNSIYSVSGESQVDSVGNCPVIVRKYRLPLISEGKEILLTEKDKQVQFKLNFANCLQGAAIRHGYMYIATGFQASQHLSPRGQRTLKIIDLEKKKITKEIDLTHLTTNEPEGFDFYGNQALVFCGQEGGIYQINIDNK